MGKIVKLLREVSPLNRRKYSRLELSKSLECTFSLEEDGATTLEPGLLINVSEGGALLATRQLKLFPKAEITVCVRLLSQETVEITGVALRTYRRNDGSAWYFSAVQFKPGNEVSIKKLLHQASVEK